MSQRYAYARYITNLNYINSNGFIWKTQIKALYLSYKNGAVLAESGNSSNNMKYRDYASSSNGGPRLRVAFMPVDYKGGGHSNPVYRSFVTPRVRLFIFRKTKNLVSHCKQTGKVLRFFVYIMPLAVWIVWHFARSIIVNY